MDYTCNAFFFFFGANFFQGMKFTLNVLALFHDLNTILPGDIFYNRVTEISKITQWCNFICTFNVTRVAKSYLKKKKKDI